MEDTATGNVAELDNLETSTAEPASLALATSSSHQQASTEFSAFPTVYNCEPPPINHASQLLSDTAVDGDSEKCSELRDNYSSKNPISGWNSMAEKTSEFSPADVPVLVPFSIQSACKKS